MDFNKLKDAVEKLTKDQATQDAFKKDPIKTIEQTIGVDLPDEQVKAIIKVVEEKIAGNGDILDKIKDEAGDLLEKAEGSEILDKIKDGLGGLFGHKN